MSVFARENIELRGRLSSIKLQFGALHRSHDETSERALRLFELLQTLR